MNHVLDDHGIGGVPFAVCKCAARQSEQLAALHVVTCSLTGGHQHALTERSFEQSNEWVSSWRVLLQVCMSTDNLFQRCRQRSRVAHGNVTNPLLQLEAIGNFVSDLGAIKEAAQKNNVKSSAPSVARLDRVSVAGDR